MGKYMSWANGWTVLIFRVGFGYTFLQFCESDIISGMQSSFMQQSLKSVYLLSLPSAVSCTDAIAVWTTRHTLNFVL